MTQFLRILRTWMLAVAILVGVLLYFLGITCIPSEEGQETALQGIKFVQPILIFVMLTITFCKVNPRDLRIAWWQFWLLLLQTAGFMGGAITVRLVSPAYVPIAEGALLCFICPTATSAAVITGKLKGDMAGVISYTMLANVLASLLIPSIVSIAMPSHQEFWYSLWKILAKVFPMLICPFFLAWGIRAYAHRLLDIILCIKDLAFYIWAICLTLAITTSTYALMHSRTNTSVLMLMGLATLATCIIQFGIGRWIGRKYGTAVAASQGVGQKNTVFAIWAGYTFFDPLSSLAGGFYSIYHNIWNSWQLSRSEREDRHHEKQSM